MEGKVRTGPSGENRLAGALKPPRQSNFELLRLVAMLMVLMLHVNFASDKFHWPQAFLANPAGGWTRAALEYAAIPAVDIFVMISGWFRIRPTWRGGMNYLFQVFYFVVIAAGLSWWLSSQPTAFWPSNIWSALWAPWFVPVYLLLYILSPILNSYLDSAGPRRTLLTTLLLYAIGWILSLTTSMDPFQGGYNILTFIVLYLIAASLRSMRTIPRLSSASLYVVATLACLLAFRYAHRPWVWSYANPLIILQSVGFILFTAKTDTTHWPHWLTHSINATAGSAFAVYLLHMNPYLFGPYFKTWAASLWSSYSGPLLILVLLGYILLWYVGALLLDQPRRWLSKWLLR